MKRVGREVGAAWPDHRGRFRIYRDLCKALGSARLPEDRPFHPVENPDLAAEAICEAASTAR